MGLKYEMIEKKGPFFPKTISNRNDINALNVSNVEDQLSYVFEAIKITKHELSGRVPLIGFAGAPWTLACYMIEGQGSKDFINTRKALWSSHKWFMQLIETLIIYIADKLEMQAKAGADILMLFDSWSHMIPNNFFNYSI